MESKNPILFYEPFFDSRNHDFAAFVLFFFFLVLVCLCQNQLLRETGTGEKGEPNGMDDYPSLDIVCVFLEIILTIFAWAWHNSLGL
ncbi:uncharacterized protein CLUP02_03993 [Colletotrichum lupini]|uniref:Uncharacterized protein n=1 Tax=Colletotrichum lupini TaxID=145971 RepID=A0A9Q8WCW1_9PEZI|nr:uncharacterized protein CLUP02_03993 [Colletotrichum lupini]UQC78516.1 hypothetical protein CLUP02_03993 [Colletotrichum lupini]